MIFYHQHYHVLKVRKLGFQYSVKKTEKEEQTKNLPVKQGMSNRILKKPQHCQRLQH